MSGILKAKKVTLREERSESGYRFLGAEIKDNGDLVFKGQDIGSGVDDAFGYREYEWCWTVKAKDIDLFKKAVGSNVNILESLKKNFSNENAAKLSEFMRNNNVPFESFSRVGD